jgi:hypothetical protein
VAESLQVQVSARRGGGRRDTVAKEAYALALAALGAVNRWTGVKWKNAQDAEGKPIAIAVIPGAKFNESKGKTTLDSIQ